ncbi:MAG: thioesterase, partial [Chloroflexi bacterium]|nr:thioesterase [Chloroflexota bacterium]
FIVNDTRHELSNTFEFVSTHADLEARKTSPFPDDLATTIDSMIADHSRLDWQAPICGVMGA